jgi:hypothetical protein
MTELIITRAWIEQYLARSETATEVTLPGDQMRALLRAAFDGLPDTSGRASEIDALPGAKEIAR